MEYQVEKRSVGFYFFLFFPSFVEKGYYFFLIIFVFCFLFLFLYIYIYIYIGCFLKLKRGREGVVSFFFPNMDGPFCEWVGFCFF